MTDDVQIEVVSEEVPEDTPTDEDMEKTDLTEEGPEVSEKEAEQFASVSKYPSEDKGKEMKREEVRDG